jgi:C4-dicarboxylate-specific signal transduction histidine kinase
MGRFRVLPLRRQLVIANLMIAAPVAALIAWSALATLRERKDELASLAQTVANLTAAHLGREASPSSLPGIIPALNLPPDSVVSVADHTGRILVQNVKTESGAFLYGERRERAGRREPLVSTGADGVRRQHAEALVDGGAWIVSVGLPLSVAFEGAARVWVRSLTILVVGLSGWMLLAWLLARRLGESVSHLDRAAQRIAAGDFGAMQHREMLSAELANLQTAFQGMLERFNTTRTALDAQMAEERRIRRELESLQGQVIRQERLAAVGQLVSGVAHEINNPLQAILGFAELLQMQPEVPESVKADLSLIQKESARACGIIRNLALFARQQPSEAAPVVMSDVIGAVAELRQRRLSTEDIDLHIEDNARQSVTAVLTELQQVLLNFVVNAEQAIVTSRRLPGRITIRTFDRGERVVLEVEDTGPGIPLEHEAKLFQPFFTTKPVGQGTGLGLSVSYGIVESLGGVIGYRRATAGGAVFYWELPAAGPDVA